jgi:hypothetical protein
MDEESLRRHLHPWRACVMWTDSLRGDIHQSLRLVDVLLRHLATECHLRERFTQTNECFELTRGGGDRLLIHTLLPHGRVEVDQLILRRCAQLRSHISTRVRDIVRECLHVDRVAYRRTIHLLMIEADQMFRELSILTLIRLIEDEIDEIEARQQSRHDLNILDDAQLGIVATLLRIRTRKDTRTSIQRAHNTGLRNRHRLLLHHFMQDRTSGITHLTSDDRRATQQTG